MTNIFNFDSRLNYQKIFMSGDIDITANTYPATASVTHGLGFKPNVRVWMETGGGRLTTMYPNNVSAIPATKIEDADVSGCGFSVDTNNLNIVLYYATPGITRTFYYRIYTDGS